MAGTLNGSPLDDMRIECGTPDVPANTPTLSIMGWGRPTSPFDTKRLMSKATATSDTGHTWMLSLNSSGNVWRSRIHAGGSTTTVSAGAITGDEWQHAACLYDGTNDINYIDGPPSAGSGANSGDVEVDAAAEYWIGSQPPNTGADEVFDGDIEDVRVYARNVSENELECIIISNGHDGCVHEMILRHPLNDNSSGNIGSGADRARGLGSLQQDGIGINTPNWTVGANVMAPRRRYR